MTPKTNPISHTETDKILEVIEYRGIIISLCENDHPDGTSAFYTTHMDYYGHLCYNYGNTPSEAIGNAQNEIEFDYIDACEEEHYSRLGI